MKMLTRAATAIALLLAVQALPLAAQDTPPADVPAVDAPVAPDTPVTGNTTVPPLDMGTPVADPGGIGQPYIRQVFGDWSLRCLRAAEGPEPCELYQLLRNADGVAVAEISMFPLPPGGQAAAGANIVAPLETLLTEQLTLTVDGGAARRYPFSFCNQAGCVARVGFSAEEVAVFKRGNSATLRIVPALAPDQEFILTISLSGFTAGFDYDTTTAPAAPPAAPPAP